MEKATSRTIKSIQCRDKIGIFGDYDVDGATSTAILGKYFETSMSNSVVCGDMPKDGEKIWNNNYIKLTNEMSDDEIISVIKNALTDKNKLEHYITEMLTVMKNYEPKS